GAQLVEVVAPGGALDDDVAARVHRAPLAEVLRALDRRHRLPLELRAPRPHRVDLVDEDDALAAPLGRELLRLAREVTDHQRVDPDERLREAGARDGD